MENSRTVKVLDADQIFLINSIEQSQRIIIKNEKVRQLAKQALSLLEELMNSAFLKWIFPKSADKIRTIYNALKTIVETLEVEL
jgi:hypothetical protein